MAKSTLPNPAEKPPAPRKLDQILTSIQSRHGATLQDLTTLTGWQPHSIRAALTRLRQRGHAIERSNNRAGCTKYQLRKGR